MAPPPSTPRAPPPTPMSPRYPSSTSSSATSSSASSSSSGSFYTATDSSYFSTNAPHTVPRSQPPSNIHPTSHSVDFTKPVISSSVTTNMNAVASMPFYNPHNSHYGGLHHTHPLPQATDSLRQFALHIPAPPQLTIPPKMSSRQPSSSNSSLSSHSSGTSGSQSPSASNTAPEMVCRTEVALYTLVVDALPPSITSDMVTISANKGDRLRINAQAWGGENAAHYEWQISFPPRDVDLSRVQARFENGGLTVRVPRWSRSSVVGMGGW